MSTALSTFYQDIDAVTCDKLRQIKLVVFDVDGTISDGGIMLDSNDNEMKKFNCKDGMGITLLLKAGIKVALLTGRNSPLTTRRAAELHIPYVIQGKMDKEQAILELISELELTEAEVAVMGDDVNDLPLYQHAAISACPADGYHYMRQIATIRLTHKGGDGSARELADLILMAQGFVEPDGNPSFLKKQNLS